MGAKPQKIEKVQELTRRFREASGAMFADFRGLSVKDAGELRRSLRDADTSLLVTKNTLTRIAVKEAELDDGVLSLLEGPTAIAFMRGDPVAGARALVDSMRRFPSLVVKGAVVEGRMLDDVQAQALARLDTKEGSFAKVAGLLTAPVSRIAYLLQAPIQRLAFGLAERGRQAAEAEPPAGDGPAHAEAVAEEPGGGAAEEDSEAAETEEKGGQAAPGPAGDQTERPHE